MELYCTTYEGFHAPLSGSLHSLLLFLKIFFRKENPPRCNIEKRRKNVFLMSLARLSPSRGEENLPLSVWVRERARERREMWMYLFGEIYFVFVSYYVIFNFYHTQLKEIFSLLVTFLISFHPMAHETSFKSLADFGSRALELGLWYINWIDFGIILTITRPHPLSLSCTSRGHSSLGFELFLLFLAASRQQAQLPHFS